MPMPDQKKILLLGGSGYIGRHILNKVGLDKCLATYFQTPLPGGKFFDPSQMSVAELIKGQGVFGHALILIGETRMDSCASDIKASKKTNVVQIISLIDELFDLGIKPIFLSTDMVFDGTQGGLTEAVSPKPIVIYGKQKVAVEQHLSHSGKQFAIIRLSKVYGNKPGDQTLVTQMLEAMASGDKISLARDQRVCPVYIDDVVDGLLATVYQDLSGIFHLAGPHSCSRVDIFRALQKALEARFKNVNYDNVHYCNINDFNFLETRPIDCSMVSHKFTRTTGLELHSIESVCISLVETLEAWPPP